VPRGPRRESTPPKAMRGFTGHHVRTETHLVAVAIDRTERDGVLLAFGQNVKARRVAAGLSKLASRCFLRRDHVSAFERGVSAPSLIVLRVLADALGVSMGELTDWCRHLLAGQERRKYSRSSSRSLGSGPPRSPSRCGCSCGMGNSSFAISQPPKRSRDAQAAGTLYRIWDRALSENDEKCGGGTGMAVSSVSAERRDRDLIAGRHGTGISPPPDGAGQYSCRERAGGERADVRVASVEVC
jgi:transcriptional regulator with XRE-family HTH domain